MCVDLLRVLFLVQVLKLGLNVTGCFIELVGSWEGLERRAGDLLLRGQITLHLVFVNKSALRPQGGLMNDMVYLCILGSRW